MIDEIKITDYSDESVNNVTVLITVEMDKINGNTETTRTLRKEYAGITNNPQKRFQEHRVTDEKYICVKVRDNKTAKEVEENLRNIGYDTGDKLTSGTDDTIYVYIYQISSMTIQ